MSDALLKLGGNKTARKLIASLGLPLPLPRPLRRTDGPWEPLPLAGRTAALGGTAGALTARMAAALSEAGADVRWADAPGGAGHAAAKQALRGALADAEAEGRFDLLVFDASGLRDVASMDGLRTFFQPLVGRLADHGRLVVLGRPPGDLDGPAAAAVQAGLEGFTRSAAKEIGRRGATATLLRVAAGAEAQFGPVLRFVASDRSAFITGQVFEVQPTAVVVDAPVKPLAGKVALVTGAARGIGQATVHRLAQEGARVICLDRPEDGEGLAETARAVGGEVLAVDVTAVNAGNIIRDAVSKGAGRIDILVHNAGITRDKTLGKMDAEKWGQVMAVNLDAILRIDEVLAAGVLAEGGREILLSSIAGLAGNAGQTNYAASKAAVAGLTRHLARSMAGRSITVNAVAPGFIETRLTAAIPLAIREPARRLSALAQGGQPVDVAELITFLASPGAAGMTGQVLRVCGGSFVGA